MAVLQHGVISLVQLVACGLSPSGVRNWVAGGRLHRLHREVFAVGRPDVTAKGRWMAAVLACGPGAVLSHASAAALHGIRATAAAQIDVIVPRATPIRRPGIRAHRCERLTSSDVTVVDGIPVTSVARTLLDLATILSEKALERVCEQAAIEGIFDMQDMTELLKRSRGCRGVRRLRTVLSRGDLGANVPASGLEIRYRELCREAGLPAPEINRYVLLGEEYHKVDFLWRKHRVVIETDGGRYHGTGWQRRRDANRDDLLAAHGYLHARVSDDAIEHRPDLAVAAARRLLAEARAASDG